MNLIVEEFKHNNGVNALLNRMPGLASLSLDEEAIIIATTFSLESKPMIVVRDNLYDATLLYNKVVSLIEETVLFQSEDSLRVEAIASSPEIKAERLDNLYNILTKRCLVITHFTALVRYLPNPSVFKDRIIKLSVDQEVAINDLKEMLIKAGYQLVARVDQPLTFAIRGGVIDIYSINHNHPFRIEFFDDFIESIRYFSLESQMTVSSISEAVIIPATDIMFSDEELSEIVLKTNDRLQGYSSDSRYYELKENIDRQIDYLNNRLTENSHYTYYGYLQRNYTLVDYFDDVFIVLNSYSNGKNNYLTMAKEAVSYIQEMFSDNKMLPVFKVYEELDTVISNKDVYDIEAFIPLKGGIDTQINATSMVKQDLPTALTIISNEATNKKVLLLLKDREIKQVVNLLIEAGQKYSIVTDISEIDIGINILHSDANISLSYLDLVIYSSYELFDSVVRKTRYTNKFLKSQTLSDFKELCKLDYVVHNLYGVGQYLGIETKEINGLNKDFLKIVYKGNDELLVPLEQFSLVRKFISSQGAPPKLNKLGTNQWEKTKERVKNSVKDIAARLIKLYSQREQTSGFAFSKDTPLQEEFDNDFEYTLTSDQEKSINEIKEDMEKSRPMDRLLCGDVGFGKTEVAMRAAFKAIVDKKQVAFLCPTTILSRQHYENFLKRFSNFPVRIAVLNRFVLPSEQKLIIEAVKRGQIDILIGTHRILSSDVLFSDLGFLIIDEEQRFGVEHKEKIKELKTNVDVLSLSATPIPRTLQMSLIGIRSLSQLNTPPVHRLPIQTYVVEKNNELVLEVIKRELARSGQVFYLNNNIDNVYSIAAKLQLKLPDIGVGVVHGRMNREEIEDVMDKFSSKEIKILVCTTIIETGIDFSNANTIIIDRADTFGLSQLYQIRGRVGRSDRLAYAYLMYNPSKQLSEIATKRLQAIKDFTQLGSGYKIAMRDLTIRGAGDLLGGQQSGFIDTVGIDMYIELLNEAIREERGEVVEQAPQTVRPQLDINAYIPEYFTDYDMEKLNLYQQIDKASTIEALVSLHNEVNDFFGKLPKEVDLLFEKKKLEILLDDKIIKNFKFKNDKIELTYATDWSSNINGVHLFETINKIDRDIQIKYMKQSIIITINKTKNWLSEMITVLKATRQM